MWAYIFTEERKSRVESKAYACFKHFEKKEREVSTFVQTEHLWKAKR